MLATQCFNSSFSFVSMHFGCDFCSYEMLLCKLLLGNIFNMLVGQNELGPMFMFGPNSIFIRFDPSLTTKPIWFDPTKSLT
jgi:hypothetical protein